MLTTTIDGLWVLQILAGIEVLAPELGLRPILPSFETAHKALAHPIAAELRAAGVIDEAGTVDSVVVEWMTVLSRRDVALLIQVRNPEVGGATGEGGPGALRPMVGGDGALRGSGPDRRRRNRDRRRRR